MKSRVFFSVLVVAVAVGAAWLAVAADPRDDEQTSPDAQLNKLLVERRDTQRQLLEAVTESFKSGTTTADSLIEAHHGLLDAELALADGKSERVKLLEEQVKILKGLEKYVKNLYTHGARGGELETYLASKSERLQAEIELVREKSSSE